MATGTQHFFLTDVRIFDGDAFTIESGHVEVQNGLIKAVGSGSPSNISKTATVISRPGCTLTPGLIDSHIHANGGLEASLTQSLKFGATTVLDMHNEAEFIAPLSALAADPARVATHSDFKYCGYCAAAPGGWPETVIKLHDKSPEIAAVIATWPKLRTVDDVKPFIQRNRDLGAGWIKIIAEDGANITVDVGPFLHEDLRREIIRQAHDAGLKVVAHAMSHALTCAVLREGIDGLAHTFLDKAPDETFVDLYRANGAHCNPTLTLLGSVTAEGQALREAFAHEPLAAKLGIGEDLQAKCACSLSIANVSKTSIENAYASARALHKGGVPLVVGTDTTGMSHGFTFGLAVHHEMYLFAHRVGMSAAEVLRAATATPAERFGLQDRGRIEVGRRADLALFEGDLRAHFADEKKLCMPLRCVWRGGVVVEAWRGQVESAGWVPLRLSA